VIGYQPLELFTGVLAPTTGMMQQRSRLLRRHLSKAQIYVRQGVDLDRSTLADWVGHTVWHLRPLHERLLVKLRKLPRLFAGFDTINRGSVP
jgi:transposase